MSDMNGKVCLVTGATSGIGKVTALELARMGAEVTLVGRDAAKTAATLEEIQRRSGNSHVTSLLADLSSMAEVRRLAAEYKRSHEGLHVLVNNAGAVFGDRGVTADGLERTFALNHLSYFLLTRELLDLLKNSAPARIVNVASGAHRGQKLDFDDLQSESYGSYRAYGRSKLANILFTRELARRLEGSGVTANCLHPGVVATGFGKNNGGLLGLAIRAMGAFILSPEEGAATSIYLASSAEVAGISGKYFSRKKEASPTAAAQDDTAARRPWEVSEQLIAPREGASAA